MNNHHQYTQLELESIFASDFKTPHFFLLATIYFESRDLNRAEKVCEIGLETHTLHLDARYMLAKIYLLNSQIIKAENFLSTSFTKKLFCTKTLKLFIEIRDSLNRSTNETKKIVDKLLELQPDDVFAHHWIREKSFNMETASNNNHSIFKMNNNIVSYTFYNVLKEQKYYHQAESVLKILESSKQISSQLYNKEQKIISTLLNN